MVIHDPPKRVLSINVRPRYPASQGPCAPRTAKLVESNTRLCTVYCGSGTMISRDRRSSKPPRNLPAFIPGSPYIVGGLSELLLCSDSDRKKFQSQVVPRKEVQNPSLGPMYVAPTTWYLGTYICGYAIFKVRAHLPAWHLFPRTAAGGNSCHFSHFFLTGAWSGSE